MLTTNQNTKLPAKDLTDTMLWAPGYVVQSKKQINLQADKGVTVREFQTDVGPADYIFFLNKKPAGLIEAKRKEEGVRLTLHKDQAEGYNKAAAESIIHDFKTWIEANKNRDNRIAGTICTALPVA